MSYYGSDRGNNHRQDSHRGGGSGGEHNNPNQSRDCSDRRGRNGGMMYNTPILMAPMTPPAPFATETTQPSNIKE